MPTLLAPSSNADFAHEPQTFADTLPRLDGTSHRLVRTRPPVSCHTPVATC